MAANKALSIQNFCQHFHFLIVAIRLFAFLFSVVFFGALEVVNEHLFHPHSRLRKTTVRRPIGLFYVFTQGEFYKTRGFFKYQLICGSSPPKFNNRRTSSNWIGRTVKELHGSYSTSQIPINTHVLWIYNVFHFYFCSTVLSAFIHCF